MNYFRAFFRIYGMWGCYYILFSVVGLLLWIWSSSILVTGYNDTLDEKNEGIRLSNINMICALRLQYLIPGLFISSLQEIRKSDPMDIGDVEDCRLYDGVFRGLSTLINLTAINVVCEGDTIIISTTLGMTDAKAKYEWRRWALHEFSGYIWTRTRKVEFAVEIVWDTPKGLSFNVTNTLVTKLDGFKFGFSGLWVLNPVVSGVVNILSRIWSGKIKDKLSELIREALSTQLNQITLPF